MVPLGDVRGAPGLSGLPDRRTVCRGIAKAGRTTTGTGRSWYNDGEGVSIMTQTPPKPKRPRRPRSSVVSPEEGRELFDREARHWLGMSGDEFVTAWEGGKFDDDPDRPGVMSMVLMMGFYRPEQTRSEP